MPRPPPPHAPAKPSYSLGAVVRLTGLSQHTIRAWERRYGAVRPARSAGGTRRYSASDVARLRLLAACVEAGHRISNLAPHSDADLEELLAQAGAAPAHPGMPLEPVREAVDRLDLEETERLLAFQFAALGPTVFARDVAAPLLREIGERWARGASSVASEHLLSAITRGILGVAVRPNGVREDAPRVLFTTPQGERHEFGAMMAAIAAIAAGAAVTYLGPDLPVDEVARAAEQVGARGVGIGVVCLDEAAARAWLRALRAALPEGTQLWVGGAGWSGGDLPGVEAVDLAALARRIGHLRRIPDEYSV